MSKSVYWLKNEVFAIAENSTSVDLYLPSDGNVFTSDNFSANFYINNATGKNWSSSNILYGFNLSKVIPWDSSNANFSIKGTFDNSNFGSYNRPEEIGVFLMPVGHYFQFQIDFLAGYYQYADNIPELFLEYLQNQSASDYKVYGGQVSSSATFNFDFRVTTPELSQDLALVFVSYAGKHNNFTVIPPTLTFTPYSDSLNQMREWQHEQEIISQNEEIIGSDEEGKESGIKGLLQKVKQLPEVIGEKLKSLFVPTEEQLDDFKTNMSSLFSEHLGGVYQTTQIFSGILTKLKDFDPYQYENCADYDFKIPAMSFFVNPEAESGQVFSGSDNGGSKFDLIPVGSDGYYHIDFSFLDNAPYKQLYVVYKGFVTVLFILMTLDFCKRKYMEFVTEAGEAG